MSPQPTGQYVGIVGETGASCTRVMFGASQPAGQYVEIVGETGASCTRVMFGVSPTNFLSNVSMVEQRVLLICHYFFHIVKINYILVNYILLNYIITFARY